MIDKSNGFGNRKGLNTFTEKYLDGFKYLKIVVPPILIPDTCHQRTSNGCAYNSQRSCWKVLVVYKEFDELNSKCLFEIVVGNKAFIYRALLKSSTTKKVFNCLVTTCLKCFEAITL
jgi:hypothetical protein